MDRSGWNPWQIAFAEHGDLESKIHDLHMELKYAHADITDYTNAGDKDHDPEWIRERREKTEALPTQIAKIEQQLAAATEKLEKVTMLNRERVVQFVGGLTGRRINPDTWSGYVSRGQAPQPDGREGGSPLWSEWTVRQWAAKAPRPGARRDLQDGRPAAGV